jgi:hypothetical protein
LTVPTSGVFVGRLATQLNELPRRRSIALWLRSSSSYVAFDLDFGSSLCFIPDVGHLAQATFSIYQNVQRNLSDNIQGDIDHAVRVREKEE